MEPATDERANGAMTSVSVRGAYRVRARWRVQWIAVPVAWAIVALAIAVGAALGPVPLLVELVALGVLALMRGVGASVLLRDSGYYAQALAYGRRDEAGHGFDVLCTWSRPTRPKQHASCVFHRGRVFAEQGELDAARSLFLSVHASGWIDPSEPMFIHLMEGLAWVEALRGDLDAAIDWQAAARRSRGAMGPGLQSTLIDVVIAARRECWEDVLRLVGASQRCVEVHTTVLWTRMLLCEAFARARVRPGTYRLASEGQAEASFEALKNADPNELACLLSGWPALRDFVASWHGSIGSATTPPTIQTGFPLPARSLARPSC